MTRGRIKEGRIRLLGVLREPKYLAIAVVSALVMAAVYIYTQVLFIVENIDLWFSVIPLHNAVLFSVFTLLFGATFAYQVHLWRRPKTCPAGQKAAGAGASGAGTFGIFFVAQCPACASLGVLFLPLSATLFLVQYGWVLNLLGIGLMLFTLNYLGAFRKEGA